MMSADNMYSQHILVYLGPCSSRVHEQPHAPDLDSIFQQTVRSHGLLGQSLAHLPGLIWHQATGDAYAFEACIVLLLLLPTITTVTAAYASIWAFLAITLEVYMKLLPKESVVNAGASRHADVMCSDIAL